MHTVQDIQLSYDGRGYFRRDESGHVCHLAGPADTSPEHVTYDRGYAGYDANCSWCWLGYTHSDDAHNARRTCDAGCSCSRCQLQAQQARAHSVVPQTFD